MFYCQDTIIKTDGTKLITKIAEITPIDIKYKRFDYLNGPLFIVSKNSVAKIIFENGVSENINYIASIPKDTFVYINTYKPKSPWVKFKLEIGAEVNNAYVNKPMKTDPYSSKTTSESFSGYDKNNYKSSACLGFSFLFGRRPHFNSVFGINHLKSKAEFIYDSYSVSYDNLSGNYITSHTHVKYNSQVDYINLFGGVRFTVAKRFHFEPLLVINYILRRNEYITGYHQSDNGNPSTKISTTEYRYYENEPTTKTHIHNSISILPRVSYDFNIKQLKFDTYVSYNANFGTQIPWWMFGVSFYPFKRFC